MHKSFYQPLNRVAAACLSVLLVTQAVLPVTASAVPDNGDHKVVICHRNNSATNPYVVIEVDTNAADGIAGNSGQDPDHYGEHQGPVASSKDVAEELKDDKIEWGDIIPPIDGVHSGQNWTAEGQAVYYNDCKYPSGKIKVNKKIDADGNGTYEGSNNDANDQGVRWGIDGGETNREMGSEATNLPVGIHTVYENDLPGYKLTGWYFTGETGKSCSNPTSTTMVVNVDVTKGNFSKSVTFCNQKNDEPEQPKPGSITIVKQVDGGDEQDFAFTTDWGNKDTFYLDDDSDTGLSDTKAFTGLNAGTYTVTEAGTEGWELDDIDCDEADADIDDNEVEITLHEDEDVTCVFTNKKSQREHPSKGNLKVVKDVVNDDGGTRTYADFSFMVHGSTYDFEPTTSPDGEKTVELPAGTYTVFEPEANTFGYATSYDNCFEVTVVAGQTVTCTITNNDKKQDNTEGPGNPGDREKGSITGHKFNDADGDAKWDEDEETLEGFTIELYNYCDEEAVSSAAALLDINECAQLLIDSDITDQDGKFEFKDLEPGSYLVCEAEKDGWSQTLPGGSGCWIVEVSDKECIVDFGNKAKAPGEVLGVVTPPAVVALVNTGTPVAQGLIVGMSIIGAAGSLSILTRKKQHSNK